MISRLPKGKRQKKEFKKVKAKTTKADKTKFRPENIKNLRKKNAQKLSKKNAQEAGESQREEKKKEKKKVEQLAIKKRYGMRYRADTILEMKLDMNGKMSPICFITPRRPIPDLVPEKYYKVIHVDVQELSAVEFNTLKREAESLRKKKSANDLISMRDKDDEDAEEKMRDKNSRESEYYTVVWLLVGGNEKLGCQWVNADDVYFL